MKNIASSDKTYLVQKRVQLLSKVISMNGSLSETQAVILLKRQLL